MIVDRLNEKERIRTRIAHITIIYQVGGFPKLQQGEEFNLETEGSDG